MNRLPGSPLKLTIARFVCVSVVVAAASTVVSAQPPPCALDSEWTRARQQLEKLKGDSSYVPPTAGAADLLEVVEEYLDAYRQRDLATVRRLTMKLPLHLDDHQSKWVEDELSRVSGFSSRVVLLKPDESNPQHVRVYAEMAIRVADRCVVDSMMTEWIKLDGKWVALPSGGYIQ